MKMMETRNCDRREAENLYEQYRNRPCHPFNKTGLCRKNLSCWFAHRCKDCGGPHPSCNCSSK